MPIKQEAQKCGCDGAYDDGCPNCWREDELRGEYYALEKRFQKYISDNKEIGHDN